MINISRFVLGTPQQNSNLTPVHKNEAFALVGDVGAQATAHDAVPSGQVHCIELSLNDLSDVVKYATLREGKRDTVDGMLLHEIVHIGILDHSIFSFLLVDTAVSLRDLSIGLPLVLLCLQSAGVRCNLCDRGGIIILLHTSNFKFIIIY